MTQERWTVVCVFMFWSLIASAASCQRSRTVIAEVQHLRWTVENQRLWKCQPPTEPAVHIIPHMGIMHAEPER